MVSEPCAVHGTPKTAVFFCPACRRSCKGGPCTAHKESVPVFFCAKCRAAAGGRRRSAAKTNAARRNLRTAQVMAARQVVAEHYASVGEYLRAMGRRWLSDLDYLAREIDRSPDLKPAVRFKYLTQLACARAKYVELNFKPAPSKRDQGLVPINEIGRRLPRIIPAGPNRQR